MWRYYIQNSFYSNMSLKAAYETVYVEYEINKYLFIEKYMYAYI